MANLVSGIKRLKSYFFQVTAVGFKRGSRFRENDRPNEQTFRDLIESVPFKSEVLDQAQYDDASGNLGEKAGLTVLATNTQVQNFSVEAGKSLVVTPENLTELEDLSQDVNIISTATYNFTGVILERNKDNSVLNRHKYKLRLNPVFIATINQAFNSLTILAQNTASTLSSYITSNNAAITSLDSRLDALEAAGAAFVLPLGSTFNCLFKPSDGVYTIGAYEFIFADGRAISRTTYAELFALIGTAFGVGNGTTTFNIPNYQDKFFKNNQGINGTPMLAATVGGASTYLLQPNNLPAHTHGMTVAKGATVAISGGSHSHSFGFANRGDAAPGSSRTYSIITVDELSESTNSVSHTHPTAEFSGSTGTNDTTAVPISLDPSYASIFVFIRVK